MESKTRKKYKYQSLTPKELDTDDVNVRVLKEKVVDKDIKNIAIMASYGAGKSSVLKTFGKEYGEQKCINVSLASFNDDDDICDECSSDDKLINDIDNRIEKSILQQILYKKEKKDLPKSKIKRIGRPSLGQIISIVACILFGVLAIGWGILFFLQISGIQLFRIRNQIYFIFSLLCALFCVGGLILGKKVSRLSYGDLDVEFNGDETESLLNKFLNEIIYFFQKTKYDTIIFEDLERFNNLGIFVKLRELNTLLNDNEVISKKHKITFVYAINNAMFKNHTERTKFFDFILPLIPILSPLNVKDDLVKSLADSGLGENWLTQEFIYDISQYITEKRVLNSIINDCITMINVLDLSKIPGENLSRKQVQLFALMAYKNICPQDFANLENGTGELADLISCARSLAQERVQRIDKEINEKRNQIERCKELPHQTLYQIKCMIKGYLSTQSRIAYSNAVEIESIDEIPDDRNTLICYTSHNGYRYGADISHIEQGLGIASLKQLWEEIKLKENDKLNKLEDEIYNLSKEKSNSTQDGFACLLNNSDEAFSQIKPTALLQMLIVNQYITEYYLDYMGRSGEEFLSSNDRKFVKQVLENNEPDFELVLASPELILRDLSDKKFERKAMLNRSIINAVFSSALVSTTQRQHFYNLILTSESFVHEAIVQYFMKSRDWNKNFVEFLINNRTDLFDLFKSHSIDKETFRDILKYMLINIDVCYLTKQSNNRVYQEILGDEISIVSLLNNKSEKLNFLQQLNFKLNSICNCDDSNTLRLIEKYNLWLITASNLQHLIKGVYGIYDYDALSKGWTLIKNMTNGAAQYIQANMEYYVTEILSKEIRIAMDEDDIIDCLENDAIELVVRKEIAKKIQTPIEYNPYIKYEIVKTLLGVDKVILNCAEIVKLKEEDLSLEEPLCYYLYNHREAISLQFESFEPLVYMIANCHKKYLVNGAAVTLYDIYKHNLTSFSWKIIKLDNDEIIRQIVISNNSFTMEAMKHIINGNYPKSLEVLVKNNIDSLVTNNLINYKVALSYFLTGDNKTKKESSVLMQCLLNVDSKADAKTIFNQTKNENIKLTIELRDRLISLGIDSADMFAAQIEYLSKEDALLWAKDINPSLEPLSSDGYVNGSSELNNDPVIQALYKMNYVHRVGNGLLRYKIKVS